MSHSLRLPTAGGRLEDYTPGAPRAFPAPDASGLNRIAYAAAHVVADPLAARDPWLDCAIDWERTIAFRRHLWSLGLGVAEAMDTAQRGMGLDWPTSLELIRRALDAAKDVPGAGIACGAGTDHLMPGPNVTIDQVIAAYEEQCGAIEKLGGRIILMASRALTAAARSPDDYLRVYDRILGQLKQPAILHWLGEMFDPALKGYWGADHFEQTLETALAVINANVAKVDGIKISLLDDQKEVVMRRRLPASVKMYSGDDFNYPELIAGDAKGFSHALLGIFDAIAPAASAALSALASGDRATYDRLMAPTVPLSRLIFRAPTQFYKTGIVFLAWLNGHQDHFVMVNGAQAMRPLPYFIDCFKLADQAGLLRDPDLATARMRKLLSLYGA